MLQRSPGDGHEILYLLEKRRHLGGRFNFLLKTKFNWPDGFAIMSRAAVEAIQDTYEGVKAACLEFSAVDDVTMAYLAATANVRWD